MYCGDETGALIGDFGSHTLKLGFAGEDLPKLDMPTVVASDTSLSAGENAKRYSCGMVALGANVAKREILKPIKKGILDLEKIDIFEYLWEFGISELLHSETNNHPTLVCDSSFNTLEHREKMVELMIEKFETPATFLAPNAMLSAFSVGRPSALVIDMGASGTTTVPVKEGYLLRKCMSRSLVGGDLIGAHLLKAIETQVLGSKLRVPATYKKKVLEDNTVKLYPRDNSFLDEIHPSYISWEKECIVADIKATTCRVWAELNFSEKAASAYAPEKYSLPDGTNLELGPIRFASPELLLNPKRDVQFIEYFLGEYEASDVDGIVPMVKSAIKSAQRKFSPLRVVLKFLQADSRKEFLQQILVVGGASLLPGTIERLQKEFTSVFPSSLKPRFLNPGKAQRKYSAWTGGSILASLGSFQQLWLSKEEYMEYGAKSLLLTKCAQ